MEWVTGDDAARHLIIFLAFVVVLGGLVLGVLKGWRAVIDQMREVVKEHEKVEKAWADEAEQHALIFRTEVLDRLETLEGEVQTIRENLISTGHLPPGTGVGGK